MTGTYIYVAYLSTVHTQSYQPNDDDDDDDDDEGTMHMSHM